SCAVALELRHGQAVDPPLDVALEPGDLAAELARAGKLAAAHPLPDRWVGEADPLHDLGLGQEPRAGLSAPGPRRRLRGRDSTRLCRHAEPTLSLPALKR